MFGVVRSFLSKSSSPFASFVTFCSKSVFCFLLYLCVLRDLFVQSPRLCPLCETLKQLLEHPFVVRQPIDRPLTRLTNRQLGSPPGLWYVVAFHQHKWMTANPTRF